MDHKNGVFSNLMQVVSGNLELIRADLSPRGEALENLNDAEKATRRAAALVRLMLTHVGQGMHESSPLDFSDEASKAAPWPRTRCRTKSAREIPVRGAILLTNFFMQIRNVRCNQQKQYVVGDGRSCS